ncbi:citrate synthase/methylcitrate synthase [Paenibacillus filicis]|uniref:Citrate synthase n=1 Tax=Paenibacillus gyeongsangnamensis TaxID=3388067 RepID=A0ABT4QBC5_9BACL|nr:citrate synthase/methylcitrate synthase [Paenibacillus filicis]MCZ8514197.1 citrate synthase/methylcitrate synthase [Paenibacillus filicis]
MVKVTGLEGVVAADTEIGLVDGEQGHLIYRGFWAKDLAVSRSFEEVAYLLWFRKLPGEEELRTFTQKWRSLRALPVSIRSVLELLPASVPMMSILQTALAAMSDDDLVWPPTTEQAMRLTAVVPTLIAARYRLLNGLPVVEPDENLDHAANYLHMLFGRTPDPAHVKALNAYLILGMEHGMNASTFAGRVVASTQSDLASSLSAAVGAMKGPLHGGAPSEVLVMLDAIGEKANAEPWLRGVLEKGGRLMGFGHRIYKTKDPRAEALRQVTEGLVSDDPWFELAIHVEAVAQRLLEEYKPGRRLYTNVEFFAAAIMRAIALPAELFTPTFTLARSVGWSAHLLEQAPVNRIFRPLSQYTGPMPEEG